MFSDESQTIKYSCNLCVLLRTRTKLRNWHSVWRLITSKRAVCTGLAISSRYAAVSRQEPSSSETSLGHHTSVKWQDDRPDTRYALKASSRLHTPTNTNGNTVLWLAATKTESCFNYQNIWCPLQLFHWMSWEGYIPLHYYQQKSNSIVGNIGKGKVGQHVDEWR